MKRNKVLRSCAAGVLGYLMIAQGYCLPEDYFAFTGRNAAVSLTNALLQQYIFFPIAEALGIQTMDPIIDPNSNGTVTIQSDATTGGDTAGTGGSTTP